MSMFEDRKKGQEGKFAMDEDARFRATARRNRLVGQWAAQKLGLSGSAADSYVGDVIRADFKVAGDSDIIAKLETDLAGKANRSEIEMALAECMQKAVASADAERASGQ